SGLDFLDDSRAFALADFNGDGRLELVLKNRSAPQVRVLQNAMSELGAAVSFCLRGTKSNRDAIGSAVTVECATLRQTKYLQAGSGFLSQHSKELFFGLGRDTSKITATVRWPSGFTQTFADIPAGHRVTIVEGESSIAKTPFAAQQHTAPHRPAAQTAQTLPNNVETWLLDPLPAPDFVLPTTFHPAQALSALRGSSVLLSFMTPGSPDCAVQSRAFQRGQSNLKALGIQLVNVQIENPGKPQTLPENPLANSSPSLLAEPTEIAGVYNILYR